MGYAKAGVFLGTLMGAACASTQKPLERIAASQAGSYTFRANANAITLAGHFQLSADTTIVTIDRTVCNVDEPRRSVHELVYACDPLDGLTGIFVRINREDPLRASTWSAVVPTTTTRDAKCLQYVLIQGRQVCQYYAGIDDHSATAGIGGTILMVPVTSRSAKP